MTSFPLLFLFSLSRPAVGWTLNLWICPSHFFMCSSCLPPLFILYPSLYLCDQLIIAMSSFGPLILISEQYFLICYVWLFADCSFFFNIGLFALYWHNMVSNMKIINCFFFFSVLHILSLLCCSFRSFIMLSGLAQSWWVLVFRLYLWMKDNMDSLSVLSGFSSVVVLICQANNPLPLSSPLEQVKPTEVCLLESIPGLFQSSAAENLSCTWHRSFQSVCSRLLIMPTCSCHYC